MPLSVVQQGRRVELKRIDAGQGLQGRLAAMGLVPGVKIEVERNSFQGPFLISVNGNRLMLGRGMAHKIIVA